MATTRTNDELGSLPNLLKEELWREPMGSGSDVGRYVHWDDFRAGIETLLAERYPEAWEALTDMGQRQFELGVSRVLLTWLTSAANWRSPTFAKRWSERDTTPGRVYSPVQLAAILRIDPPPELAACSAYIEHLDACGDGCVNEGIHLEECDEAKRLLAAAEDEYQALAPGQRSAGWAARA